MFDLGWTEMVVIAMVALVVIGPKELPRALKTIAALVRKLRAMTREFQSGVEEMVREAELDDIKREIDSATSPDIGRRIENMVDPTGSVSQTLTLDDIDAKADKPDGPAPDAAAETAADAPSVDIDAGTASKTG